MRAFTSILTAAAVGGTLALLFPAGGTALAQWGLPYSYSARQVRPQVLPRAVQIDGYAVRAGGLTITRYSAATWIYGSTGPYPVFLGGGHRQWTNPGLPRSTERAEPSVKQFRDWQREMWMRRR